MDGGNAHDFFVVPSGRAQLGRSGHPRGMALLYGDRELTRERFEHRRKRYSPYGSVVSLYLWSLAGMEEALAVKLPKG